MIEENLWRAIRYGLSGSLIDFRRGEPVPARARIEQLIDWVAPVAEELGGAPLPRRPRRERRRAADRSLAARVPRSRRSTPSRYARASALAESENTRRGEGAEPPSRPRARRASPAD